jgi:hypothetical protein
MASRDRLFDFCPTSLITVRASIADMGNRPSAVVIAISTIFIAAALAGCVTPDQDSDDGSDGQADQGQGDVSFYVKDAPADDFDSVFVTFNRVQVHRAGEGGDDDLSSVPDDDLSSVDDDDLSTVPDSTLSTVPEDDLEDGGAGWITIVDSEHTIDLKDYQGDARAFLGESAIDAGKYTQIRINVSDVYGMNGTNRTDFTLPSNTLKIVRPWTVTDGEETVLVVDFDLNESIHKSGNGAYRMKPVLKLTVENGQDDSAADDSDEATDAAGGKPTDKGKPSNSHKP